MAVTPCSQLRVNTTSDLTFFLFFVLFDYSVSWKLLRALETEDEVTLLFSNTLQSSWCVQMRSSAALATCVLHFCLLGCCTHLIAKWFVLASWSKIQKEVLFFFLAGLLFHWFMEGTGSQVASLGGSRILNGFTNSGNFAAGGINAVWLGILM